MKPLARATRRARFPVRENNTLQHENTQFTFLVFLLFILGCKGFYCSEP